MSIWARLARRADTDWERIVALYDSEPALRDCHLLPTVRGDLLAKLGRHDEARAQFERAASLATNSRERAVLLQRSAESSPPTAADRVCDR